MVGDVEKPDHDLLLGGLQISGKQGQCRAGSVPGEFTATDLAFAAFKVIQADRGVQIGQFRIVAGLATGKQALKQGHERYSG